MMALVNADVATIRIWPVLPENMEPQDSGVWAELWAWGCERFMQRAARFVSDSANAHAHDVTPQRAPGFPQETPHGRADPARTHAGAGAGRWERRQRAALSQRLRELSL